MLSQGHGTLIPAKRQTYTTEITDYLPCQHCLWYFIRSDLWKHQKCCHALKLKPEATKVTGRIQGRAAMLLPLPKTADQAFHEKVLRKMNNDAIGLAVRQDELILKFGLQLFMKFTELHQNQYCSQKMREVGRLLLKLKQIFEGCHLLATF